MVLTFGIADQLFRAATDPEAKTAVSDDVSPPWYQQVGVRITSHWLLKFTSSVVFMAVFFAGYFLLLKYPLFHPRAMPVLAVDRWIPFQPGALWIYVSLWFYVQLAPALFLRRSEVVAYGKALVGMSAVGFVLFFFCPTTLGDSNIDWSRHAAFQTLKEVDASGNACPSLHVAFALFTAFSLAQSLRKIEAPRALYVFNALWCLGISYSTLATRQHVFLDVLGGVLLAAAVWGVYARFGVVRSVGSPGRA